MNPYGTGTDVTHYDAPHVVDSKDTGRTFCGLAVDLFEPLSGQVSFGMACQGLQARDRAPSERVMADLEDDPFAVANRAVRELLSLNLIGVPDGETTVVELAGGETAEMPKLPLEIIQDAMSVPADRLFAVAETLLERAVVLLAESDAEGRPVNYWLEELLRPDPPVSI